MSTVTLQFDPYKEKEHLLAAQKGLQLKRVLQGMESYFVKEEDRQALERMAHLYKINGLLEYREKLEQIRRNHGLGE